jgi:hypothetical protein
MDAKQYKDAIEYEKLTQAIYQAILREEGIDNIIVEHNVNIKGRSDVEHQIDVFWKFKQAHIDHSVLIECKNYSEALKLEKVRNFHAVTYDIGNCNGIMVTKIGWQSGAKIYAEYYGIDLKILRKPIKKDWEGKIKDIKIHSNAKTLVSNEDMPIKMELVLNPKAGEQETYLKKLQEKENMEDLVKLDTCFVNYSMIPVTDEIRWWLPKQLDFLKKAPGGPYTQEIELEDFYIIIKPDGVSEQPIQVKALKISYWVEQFDFPEITIYGEQVVKAILKDYCSGETEYILRDKSIVKGGRV